MKTIVKRVAPAGISRDDLSRSIGRTVSRFQESSNAFDDVAAEILALDLATWRA